MVSLSSPSTCGATAAAPPPTLKIRAPVAAEHLALAQLWHAAWHEAHRAHVPAKLAAMRTRQHFAARLAGLAPDVRAAFDADRAAGFCAVSGRGEGELDQLFVAPWARGTGLAARLLADGEARLRAAGLTRPVLACLPENLRARAFYRRHGWQELGIESVVLATPQGPVRLASLMLEKRLT